MGGHPLLTFLEAIAWCRAVRWRHTLGPEPSFVRHGAFGCGQSPASIGGRSTYPESGSHARVGLQPRAPVPPRVLLWASVSNGPRKPCLPPSERQWAAGAGEGGGRRVSCHGVCGKLAVRLRCSRERSGEAERQRWLPALTAAREMGVVPSCLSQVQGSPSAGARSSPGAGQARGLRLRGCSLAGWAQDLLEQTP